VDERQRDELGEAASLGLYIAQDEEVSGPVYRAFHVPEHDRRRGAQAQRVRYAHDLRPLGGVHLVGADDLAYLVLEDLRRRPRQRPQPRLLEQPEELFDGYAKRPGSLRDL